ncbi:MAG: hypothetical protein SCL54_15920, partial [Bacillota bacterium]|nr:hypothetical protein [Bacillota bacterium]
MSDLNNFEKTDDQVQKLNIQRKKVKNRVKRKKALVYSVVYLFLAFLVVVAVVPFWIVIINSTRDGMSISTQGITLIPGKSLLENYKILVENVNIGRGFWNSLKIATLVT